MKSYGEHKDGLFVIGNGVGIVGRWMRLFLGINTVIYLVINPVLLNPIPKEELLSFASERLLALAALTIIYIVVFKLFGKLLFARLSPWAGTAVFLGLPTLLVILHLVPPVWQMAFGMYVGLSLILTFFLRYGGCEVVSIPSLLFKNRYTMYCPLNAIDSVERAVAPDTYSKGHQAFMLLSLGIVSIVGGYYYIFEGWRFFSRYGLAFELPSWTAWSLIIPFAYSAYMGALYYKKEKSFLAPPVRKFGMGAFVLILMAINFGVPEVHFDFWHWIMAGGTLYVLFEIVMVMIGKKKLREI